MLFPSLYTSRKLFLQGSEIIRMPNELRYWLALRRIEGVGSVVFRTLQETLGSPASVFNTPAEELQKIPGVGIKTARRIVSFKNWEIIDEELDRADKNNVHIVTYLDPLYPSQLLNIHDFPPLIYVRGSLSQQDVRIAVVGSRQASTHGKFITEKLCRELAMSGAVIVSGMARGIDTAAHRGAMAGRGRTIAILGSGLDVIYPQENKRLYGEIIDHGAVISEFPLGTAPNAPNLPARNRIISGMSLGVVVVEASCKSGSLITARLALEQGREIFAVPGAIDSAGSRGTHRLIKEGAKLVETVEDILEEIRPQVDKSHISPNRPAPVSLTRAIDFHEDKERRVPADQINEQELKIVRLLSPTKTLDVDDMTSILRMLAGVLLNHLLSLEIKGVIRHNCQAKNLF